jgi:hypothetical protein
LAVMHPAPASGGLKALLRARPSMTSVRRDGDAKSADAG